MSRSVLVIGATGILAPAWEAFRSRGDGVVAVSRHGARGSIAVDARDAPALRAALDGEAWIDAVVYAPAVSAESLSYVRGATTGRCVLVRTSDAAAPEFGTSAVPRDTLQLGWTDDPTPRWHTPAEVSCAALEVLADGMPRTLGVVRPWSDRP